MTEAGHGFQVGKQKKQRKNARWQRNRALKAEYNRTLAIFLKGTGKNPGTFEEWSAGKA